MSDTHIVRRRSPAGSGSPGAFAIPVGVAWMRPLAPLSAVRRSGLALGATAVQVPVQPLGQGRGPRRVLVDDDEACRPQAQHGVGAGGSGPAGADEHHPREVGARQGAPEPPAPARAIRVVPHESIAPPNDGVDRTDGFRFLGQLIEKRDHRLLARIGDVQPGEAHDARGLDDGGQGLHAAARGLEVDQLVVQAKAVMAGLLLLESRGQRALDAGADETAENRRRHASRLQRW